MRENSAAGILEKSSNKQLTAHLGSFKIWLRILGIALCKEVHFPSSVIQKAQND